jgi:hypothetical protein
MGTTQIIRFKVQSSLHVKIGNVKEKIVHEGSFGMMILLLRSPYTITLLSVRRTVRQRQHTPRRLPMDPTT